MHPSVSVQPPMHPPSRRPTKAFNGSCGCHWIMFLMGWYTASPTLQKTSWRCAHVDPPNDGGLFNHQKWGLTHLHQGCQSSPAIMSANGNPNHLQMDLNCELSIATLCIAKG
jgi:hypothetical protein